MSDSDASEGSGGALADEHHDWVSSVLGVDPRQFVSDAVGSVVETAQTVAADVGDAAAGVVDTAASVVAGVGDAAAGVVDAAGSAVAGVAQGAGALAGQAAGAIGSGAMAMGGAAGAMLPPIALPPSREIMEFGVGVLRGAEDALTPLGVGGLLPTPMDKSKPFEVGRGIGQMVAGGAEMLAGGSGEVVGTLLDFTGIGALVGIPVNVASAALILQGAATMAVGINTMAHASTMAGDGGGGGGSPSEPTPALPAEPVPGELGPVKPKSVTELPDAPGGELKGPLEPVPNDLAKAEDLRAQEEALQAVSRKGLKVDRVTKATKGNYPELAKQIDPKADPDAVLRGPDGTPKQFADVYSPRTDKLDNIWSTVDSKSQRQGPAVIVNLKNSKATPQAVIESVSSAKPTKLTDLYVVAQDGTVTHVTY